MAVVEAIELSTYIISFAGAAKAAQLVLSDGMDPMTISEYKLKSRLHLRSKSPPRQS